MERACKICGKWEDIPPKGARCKACVRDYNLQYYKGNRDSVKDMVRRYREANYDKARASSSRCNKRRWKELRAAAFREYGESCACCGEAEPQFLCIDHVNNDGAEHRKKDARKKFGIYGWLERAGYPKDGRFQVLCHNCNFSKHSNGGVCIHKLQEGSTTRRKPYTQAGGSARHRKVMI